MPGGQRGVVVKVCREYEGGGMGETRRAIGEHLLPLPPSRARVGLPSYLSLDPKTLLALPSSQPGIRRQESLVALHVNDLDTLHVISNESNGIPYMLAMDWETLHVNNLNTPKYELFRAMGDGFCSKPCSHLLERQVLDGGTRQYYAIVRFVLDLAESLIVGIHCEDRGVLRVQGFTFVSETG
jgi:hypothetical protein